ncbi:kinase-like domain-containing protein [Polychytrium aggregatum]|uniref:kinase-like domain-containing protein n=1 Tax=Polychytrium aggregatum TaxID=110093 RepID=UPI0022FE19FC|nr:kinase-like domain-containing protein [Polychytrium aggregatum]KAI9202519.1 kinase-like domain-containing protein [Polychytrium aggregatum]
MHSGSTTTSDAKRSSTKKKFEPRTFTGCSKIEDYETRNKIGEGTFGEVSFAQHKKTEAKVALKRILMHSEKEGIPITALREIKILKSLNHPNIVPLLEMAIKKGDKSSRSRGSIFMVFPYMDYDLAGLLENPAVRFNQSQIKSYIKQLLEGTYYLHQHNILHRDMKGANILIDAQGNLKLADFGLARSFNPEDPNKAYTTLVVTRWYRPPELLLGATKYNAAIDMWGVGCVIGEIFKRRPILTGTSDIDQLEKIFELCGTPNKHNWPSVDQLTDWGKIQFKVYQRNVLRRFEQYDRLAIDLMDKLLALEPATRLTAGEALKHDYFYHGWRIAVPGTKEWVSDSA